ncbi:MAG: hypothetical protein KF824_07525 [Fimbriimonadaceae bacterium]|nr:MAG: hypothetical protein KF824_07525 [Fimbriimonadaceae bacterium]
MLGMRLLCGLLLMAPVMGQTQTLKTRWTDSVTPQNVHQEYPRPQMVRDEWVNLNGTWQYAINGKWGEILVPFPVESKLSRVQKTLKPSDTLHYHRNFRKFEGARTHLLHIGASDWKTRIEVNGQIVGEHEGGFDPITLDITDALSSEREVQSLDIFVTDPTDSGPQPRGKQVLKPGGIFYVPTSGIWQTVWMEPVHDTFYISDLDIHADPTTGKITVAPTTNNGEKGYVEVEVLQNGKRLARAEALGKTEVTVRNPKLWSPESPTLYDLKIKLVGDDGRVFDEVKSYTAFRKFSIERDKDGVKKFFLNGKPYFLMGTLDQGFWPDGLFTAPTDEALKYDLEVQKRLGFNFIRKHVKVEPARWYYHCDKLGLLVMQDMPSGDRSIGPNDPDIVRTPESAAIFKKELKAMIDSLKNHPSIFSWVVFNEGWGQFDTVAMADWTQKYDQTRLAHAVTGWADRGVGAFKDPHIYPGPGAPTPDANRALLLGEYGGLGLPIPGHMWQESGWGYQSYKTQDELTNAFCDLMFQLRILKGNGLSGAVYTQTTDVETETNGLMTYDRAMLKMDEKRITQAIKDVYKPAPKIEVLLPTSEQVAQKWLVTTVNPGSDWVSAKSWKGESERIGGFGTPETPGSIVRSRWDTPDIWLRRSFAIKETVTDGVYLKVSHDDDVEVYLDGKLVFKAGGWTTSYKLVKLGGIKAGNHQLRIHVHQNQGGQYIDAGLVRVK